MSDEKLSEVLRAMATSRSAWQNPYTLPWCADQAATLESSLARAQERAEAAERERLRAMAPLGCHDCGLVYGGLGWCDVVVPDYIWVKISPTGGHGGILCFSCIARRCDRLRLQEVPFSVKSGPMRIAADDEVFHSRLDRLRAERDAAIRERDEARKDRDDLNRLVQDYGDGGLDGPSLVDFLEWRDQRDEARAALEDGMRFLREVRKTGPMPYADLRLDRLYKILRRPTEQRALGASEGEGA